MEHTNTQSRKWILVLNNPLEFGYTHEKITETLMMFLPDYYCGSDEVGESGTPHTHIFVYSRSPIRFNTIKSRFPMAHIEQAYGSVLQNRAYIEKSGVWVDSEKASTSVENSFFEYGVPDEKADSIPKMSRLIENIRAGKKTSEIIDDTPNYAFRIRDIDILRQTLMSEKYTTENRDLNVTYLYGKTGAGKTRSIYQAHDPRGICRITNYRTGRGISFDGYHGQDVLVFEEFNSQIPIEDMLNYLDVYPIFLPARYNDKTACFTQAYITSNLTLFSQYKDVQIYRPETWQAFLRRIHKVVEYRKDGTISETILQGGDTT